MTSTRGASVATGTLLLVAIAAVFVADALRPSLTGPGYLDGLAQHPARVAASAVFYLVAAGTSVGIAVALYPVLRAVDAGLALASVVFRTLEAASYTAAVVGLTSVLTLAVEFAAAAPDRRAPLLAVADSLVTQREHATLVAVFAFCTGAFAYYLALYRARLVPRWLSGWGVAAVLSLLTACGLALFADRLVTSYWPLAVPIAVQEIVLGGWLLARGFSAPPAVTAPAPDAAPTLVTAGG